MPVTAANFAISSKKFAAAGSPKMLPHFDTIQPEQHLGRPPRKLLVSLNADC